MSVHISTTNHLLHWTTQTYMHNIIHTILPNRISIRIEEAKRIVRTTVHRQIDLAHVIIDPRRRLGPAERALLVAVANIELVVIPRERPQARSLNLDRVVDIAGSIRRPAGFDVSEVVRFRHAVVDADGRCRDSLRGAVVVERHVAGDDAVVVDRVVLRANARP